jgi:hypothetical protein
MHSKQILQVMEKLKQYRIKQKTLFEDTIQKPLDHPVRHSPPNPFPDCSVPHSPYISKKPIALIKDVLQFSQCHDPASVSGFQ